MTASSNLPQGLFFDLVRSDEVDAAHRIEAQGFPPDEAASLEKLRYRQKHAPDLFLGAYVPTPSSGRTLIGHAISTAASALTLESMSEHSTSPDAHLVCLHSLVVAPSYQGRGVARALIGEYVRRLAEAERRKGAEGGKGYEAVALLAHEQLKPFYKKIGFEDGGRSAVAWGTEPWWEMRLPLSKFSSGTSSTSISSSGPPNSSASSRSPAGLSAEAALAALRAQQSARPSRNPGKPVGSFGGSMKELIAEGADGKWTNRADLFCPREECGCLLVRKGAAEFVERDGWPLADPNLKLANSPAPPSSSTSTSTAGLLPAFSVPSPLSFENVGFSKDATVPSRPSAKVKYLTCADCDCGPLGWHELSAGGAGGGLAQQVGEEVKAQALGHGGGGRAGGQEFLLAADRVRYRLL